MNVLITGGTGFIGARLAQACHEAGDTVRALGLRNSPAEDARADDLEARGIDMMYGSVADRDTVRRAVAGVNIIYHLAAAQHETGVSDSLFWDVNVRGTEHILEAGERERVQRIVHGSTIGVYGGVPGVTVDENAPLKPTNIYGQTKLEAEKLVKTHGDSLPAVVVRISETYGPGDERLLKLFRTVLSGKFLMIGRGENLHHLVFVDDLVEGLRVAAVADEAVGKTWVLSGSEAVPTRAMVAAVAKSCGMAERTRRLPMWPFWITAIAMEQTLGRVGFRLPLSRRRLNFFLLSFRFSNTAAHAAWGYEPKIDLEEGMRKTAQWYREQGRL